MVSKGAYLLCGVNALSRRTSFKRELSFGGSESSRRVLRGLAEEWGLTARTIIKGDPRFEAFAELGIGMHSRRKLERPRKPERQAIEFAYSAPKAVSIAATHDPRIAGEMASAVEEELKGFEGFACCRDRRDELYNSEAARRTGKMLAAAFVHDSPSESALEPTQGRSA